MEQVEQKAELNPRYANAVAHFAKEREIEDGKGLFTLGDCELCGTITLNKLDPKPPREVQLISLGNDCPNCKNVHQRAPEIFMWVLNVIATQHNKHHPELKETV